MDVDEKLGHQDFMNILHEVSKVYGTRVDPVQLEGEVRRGGGGGWRRMRSARHAQHWAAAALPRGRRTVQDDKEVQVVETVRKRCSALGEPPRGQRRRRDLRGEI